MEQDAFSKRHPAVNFSFFLGAICCCVVLQHPACLLVSLFTGGLYYLLLRGRKGLRTLAVLIPLFFFITLTNPFLNTYGETVLFRPFGRPYTLEALLYGGAMAGIFVSTALWFGCYNQVMTSDKFTALFGDLIPALSMLLVMVLRLVPAFLRKIHQISGARKAIGKSGGQRVGRRKKLEDGLTILGALVTWALEGSVVTGDSMRARGYGCTKRTGFMHRTMVGRDWTVLALMALFMGGSIFAACGGQFSAEFTPNMQIAPLSWGIACYGVYFLIPSIYHIKEAVQWHISKSKI